LFGDVRCGRLRGLLKLVAVLVGGQLGVLPEQARKEVGVVVPHVVTDGLDAFAGGRKQPFGGLYAQALQVMQGFVACRQLEAPHKITNAHAVLASHVLEAELVGKVFFELVLDLQNDHVLMQLLPAKPDAAGGVVALHFIQDVACDGLGNIGATEAFDQVNVKVAG